jgi:hypothetical protein
MAWAGVARRVAAAARLIAGMNGRAVDGLEGGDTAGHLKLRDGKKVGKEAEFSEVAPSAQATCLSGNPADFNIAPSRYPRRERPRSMHAPDQVYPSRQPSFMDCWRWPKALVLISDREKALLGVRWEARE